MPNVSMASELDEVVTWLTMTTPEEVNNLWAVTFCDEAKAMRQKAVTLVWHSTHILQYIEHAQNVQHK